jgi:hypothetical protein
MSLGDLIKPTVISYVVYTWKGEVTYSTFQEALIATVAASCDGNNFDHASMSIFENGIEERTYEIKCTKHPK